MKSRILTLFALTLIFSLPSLTLVAQNQAGNTEPPPPPTQSERPAPPTLMQRPAPPVPTMRVNAPNARIGIPGLTEAQRTDIQALLLDSREEAIGIENQRRELQARLRTLTTGETVNMGEASDVIDEIADLQAEEMKLRVNQQNEIRELLTDEQKVLFDSRSRAGNRSGFDRGDRQQGRANLNRSGNRNQRAFNRQPTRPGFGSMMRPGNNQRAELGRRQGMMSPPPAPTRRMDGTDRNDRMQNRPLPPPPPATETE